VRVLQIQGEKLRLPDRHYRVNILPATEQLDQPAAKSERNQNRLRSDTTLYSVIALQMGVLYPNTEVICAVYSQLACAWGAEKESAIS
jgi:hypothetical protein